MLILDFVGRLSKSVLSGAFKCGKGEGTGCFLPVINRAYI